MFSVRKDRVIKKQVVYVVLGVDSYGLKDVLSIEIGETESAKFWLAVLNNLKNRGIKDILVLCADGLAGIKEAISAAFPMTEYQRCIVHMVRNTLMHVPHKHKKSGNVKNAKLPAMSKLEGLQGNNVINAVFAVVSLYLQEKRA